MTATLRTEAPHPAAVSPAERAALATAALCALWLVPTLLASAIDGRTLNGIGVWAKPMKFQLSLALHWLTVAWLLRCMDAPARHHRHTHAAVVVGTLASLVEILYIVLQAARGRASHFNQDTAWESFLYYAVMGPGAVAIVAATAWLGLHTWRHRAPGSGTGLWLGASWGLMLGGVLTLVVAAPLSAGVIDGPGHWVGGQKTDALGLPLVGWSTTGGDLRVPHFFATHLVQALPLLGWLADRIAPRHAARWVLAGAVLGVAVIAGTLWQAVAGRPLLG